MLSLEFNPCPITDIFSQCVNTTTLNVSSAATYQMSFPLLMHLGGQYYSHRISNSAQTMLLSLKTLSIKPSSVCPLNGVEQKSFLLECLGSVLEARKEMGCPVANLRFPTCFTCDDVAKLRDIASVTLVGDPRSLNSSPLRHELNLRPD